MEFLGSLLSAGSSLLGGLFGQSNNNAALAAQQAMNDRNIAEQEKFAQQGLQWRAADATAAQANSGINRLALLGAPTSSFSNVVGSFPSDNPVGKGIAGAGQDIGRALNAFADKNDRQRDLQNKLLEAQIANVNSDTVKNQAAASKVVTQAPTAPTPLYETFVDDKGNKVTLPSGKASTSLQNIASWPSNLAIGGHMLMKNLFGGWTSSHGSPGVRGDSVRASIPVEDRFYTPF